jgi:hypothetical protein
MKTKNQQTPTILNVSFVLMTRRKAFVEKFYRVVIGSMLIALMNGCIKGKI